MGMATLGLLRPVDGDQLYTIPTTPVVPTCTEEPEQIAWSAPALAVGTLKTLIVCCAQADIQIPFSART